MFESQTMAEDESFDDEFFMVWLLPPIIFAAGYNMNVPAFFDNLGPTMLLAFGGTVLSAAVVGACVKPWSPERHWLFHAGVRGAVKTLLLVEQRLQRRAGVSEPPPRSNGWPIHADLPLLPRELWLMFCSFVTRGGHGDGEGPALPCMVGD